MTPQRIEEIRTITDAATRGPWGTGPTTLAGDVWVYSYSGPVMQPNNPNSNNGDGFLALFKRFCGIGSMRSDFDNCFGDVSTRRSRWWEACQNNASFIAMARTAVPELLSEVARLREEIKKHRDVPGVVMLGRDLELYKALEEK